MDRQRTRTVVIRFADDPTRHHLPAQLLLQHPNVAIYEAANALAPYALRMLCILCQQALTTQDPGAIHAFCTFHGCGSCRDTPT